LPSPVLGPSTIPAFLSLSTPVYYSIDKPTILKLPYGIARSTAPSPSYPPTTLPSMPPAVMADANSDIDKLATQILTLPGKGTIYEYFSNQTIGFEIPRINFTLGALLLLLLVHEHLFTSLQPLRWYRINHTRSSSMGIILSTE